jgi:hypothetical protein
MGCDLRRCLLIPNAVEEVLRLDSSLVAWRRRATQDTTLHPTASRSAQTFRAGLSRCRQTRMLYREKRYIVTATFDGHWAWVVILSSRLSLKGRAITKFEAIEQATHLIDRAIWFRTQQSTPV